MLGRSRAAEEGGGCEAATEKAQAAIDGAPATRTAASRRCCCCGRPSQQNDRHHPQVGGTALLKVREYTTLMSVRDEVRKQGGADRDALRCDAIPGLGITTHRNASPGITAHRQSQRNASPVRARNHNASRSTLLYRSSLTELGAVPKSRQVHHMSDIYPLSEDRHHRPSKRIAMAISWTENRNQLGGQQSQLIARSLAGIATQRIARPGQESQLCTTLCASVESAKTCESFAPFQHPGECCRGFICSTPSYDVSHDSMSQLRN